MKATDFDDTELEAEILNVELNSSRWFLSSFSFSTRKFTISIVFRGSYARGGCLADKGCGGIRRPLIRGYPCRGGGWEPRIIMLRD